jgi:hypothetical protein
MHRFVKKFVNFFSAVANPRHADRLVVDIVGVDIETHTQALDAPAGLGIPQRKEPKC